MRTGLTPAIVFLGGILTLAGTTPVRADLIPPGNKAVSHKLVFVDSPLLQEHRVIAMPVRGFGGHEEVRAGQPFHFSSKYGTRLYVVPDDFQPPSKVTVGDPLPFPSCEVPVSSTTYVPKLSPITSLRSTLKLVAVNDDTIEVELVDHVELNSSGEPVTVAGTVLPWLIIASVGFVGCVVIWRRTRVAKEAAQPNT